MKKLIFKSLIFFAVIYAFCSLPVLTADMQDVKLKIERVALFKNGLGYFTSTALLPDDATVINFGQLPVPSLGTFWVGYPEGVKVRGIFADLEDVEETFPAGNVGEIIAANVGRKVKIIPHSKDIPPVEGIITDIQRVAEQEKTPSPYFMDIRRPRVGYRLSRPVGNFVALKTESGTVVINQGSIQQANFEENEIKTTIINTYQRPRVRMELEEAEGGERIGVSYLARGISWVPSYIFDLSQPEKARFTAKALVINEVADLDKVRLDLVTGFPNIRFAELISPIALSQSLADFLQTLATGRLDRSPGSMLTQQHALSNLPMSGEVTGVPMPAYSTAREGIIAEDFFLYPVGDFSLKRGETACIPLFTAEVPYEHIYVWKVPDNMDRETHRSSQGRDEDRPPAEEVWHSCRITNTMKMPWTTASAEFIKDGQFTGQDICYYTAPGAETTIRINRAMNVLAEEAEFEVGRKRDATRFHGYSYDLVRLEGELKVRNRLDIAANMEVTKELSGDVIETVPEAKVITTAKGLKKVNPTHRLTWKFELEPEKDKTVLYTYEVYIRR